MGRCRGQAQITGTLSPVLVGPFIDVPADQNILEYTAEFVFKKSADASALAVENTSLTFDGASDNASINLSKTIVLLPNSQAVEQFNPALYLAIPQNITAIIPPWCGTLKHWASEFISSSQPDYEIINNHTRQLLFIEALQQHPALFKEENQWQVTQALLDLFDDLNLNQKQLFSSADEWQVQLQQAYGLEQENQHLLHESKLVFTLWHAWQQQLNDSNLLDETTDYVNRLKSANITLNKQYQFIFLGYEKYSRTEQEFIKSLVDRKQCTVIDFENDLKYNDENDYESHITKNHKKAFPSFIYQAFTPTSTPVKIRAENFASEFPDKSELPFSTYLAANDEEQVRAIDFFIRSNLLNGKNNIAVISEDRKLSRRLRALLERANIQLNDKAGWSLATTQASTIIERWLECIEEDFSAYPLLDCLKSPFVSMSNDDITTDSFQKNIYRLEHDIIFHENISSNIGEYKKQLKKRLKRLTHWPQNSYKQLIDTLNFIQDSSANLSTLYNTNKKIHLSKFLNTLLDSLNRLNVLENYQKDEAGLKLLETFEYLKSSINHADPLLSWQDCRTWLGLALETENFTLAISHSPVQLMTLEQATYLTFDCIIFAATESQHFPGGPDSSPFFNQAVRASLELSTWEKQNLQRKNLFCQTLLSSPTILLTACNEDNGEEKPVSPWLQLLINFYQLAYNESTESKLLSKLVESQNELVLDNQYDRETEPLLQTTQAASQLPGDLVPERVSASAYQRLINCPYQYFSADGLQLKPLEEISDELKKSDYGERIHLILQCFHQGHDKYGAAYSQPITYATKEHAEQFLVTLSEKIFLQDLENNILHRSWLYRWQKHIPAYINWQIKHQVDWSLFESEKIMEVEMKTIDDNQANNITVYGRLDRIDKNRKDKSQAIIDYKTGKCANQDDVDNGENIQLSTYAILDNKANVVSYLSLDSSSQKVETKASLSGDDLETNREHNKQRLNTLFTQIHQETPLTSWGDDHVCRYCNFSGLCRKQEWAE